MLKVNLMGCFGSNVYLQGDFTFIRNHELRKSLTYDYNNCFETILLTKSLSEEYFVDDQSRRSSELDRENPPNLWDTPPGEIWKIIVNKSWPFHNERTYKYNMKILYILKIYGWENFLKTYKECKYPFT